MPPKLSRKTWIALAIAGAVLLVLGLLLPHLLHWFVGGALGGAAVLHTAQASRRKADRDHKKAIKAERKEVGDIQDEADKAVEDAISNNRSPQHKVAGLTEEERRDRLKEAADKLK